MPLFLTNLISLLPIWSRILVPALSQIKDILMKLLIKSRLLTDQQSQTLFLTGINKGIVLIFERGELINWCNNLKPILKQTYQQGHLQDFKWLWGQFDPPCLKSCKCWLISSQTPLGFCFLKITIYMYVPQNVHAGKIGTHDVRCMFLFENRNVVIPAKFTISSYQIKSIFNVYSCVDSTHIGKYYLSLNLLVYWVIHNQLSYLDLEDLQTIL